MKNKMRLFSIIMGLICGALSYWFNAYNEMYVLGINIYILMGILSVLLAIFLGVRFKKEVYSIPLYYSFGFIIAVLGRIFFDIAMDSSTHNLFPFEIVFVLVIIIPASYCGALFINFINKRNFKHLENNSNAKN